jgi:hypothetical protein
MILDSVYLPPGDVNPERLRTDLDSPSTLVLLFSGLSQEVMQAPVALIRAAFPRSIVIGCSTAGEVVGTTVRDGGIAITVARFERTSLTTGCATITAGEDSFACGVRLAKELQAPSLRAAVVLSDGLMVNGSELLLGLNRELGDDVIVTGGLAGDADRFVATWVVGERGPTPGIVAAVGFHGDAVQVGHGSRGGWDVFGPQRVVTRSDRNVVFEFDGRPALDLYEEYLGDLASGLPGSGLFFPLAITKDAQDPDVLVRTLLGIDRDERSLRYAGDVPTGWNAQLMRANLDRLVAGAAAAAGESIAAPQDAGEDCLGIAISCVGRRLVLKDRIEDELEAVVEALPNRTHLAGFYSYGEIAPAMSGRSGLHNQTMTLTTLSERPG